MAASANRLMGIAKLGSETGPGEPAAVHEDERRMGTSLAIRNAAHPTMELAR